MSKATSYVVLGVAAFLVGGFSFRLVDHAGESKAESKSTESKADSGEANAAVPRYFAIEGMTCQGCADSITAALTRFLAYSRPKCHSKTSGPSCWRRNPRCRRKEFWLPSLRQATKDSWLPQTQEHACHGCHFQQAAHFHQHHSGQERIARRFNGTWTRSIGHQGRQAGCCVPQCGCAGFCGKGFGR